MFIGHLPAGYLITCGLFQPLPLPKNAARRCILAGLTGAIAPDFDLIWCYLVDHGQRHHHLYPTHWPLIWFSALLLLLLWAGLVKNKYPVLLCVVFCVNGIVHLLLDSLVGDIGWLMPFDNTLFALAHVPAQYHPWWLNFFLHWSFMLEMALVVAAIWLWRRRRKASLIEAPVE